MQAVAIAFICLASIGQAAQLESSPSAEVSSLADLLLAFNSNIPASRSRAGMASATTSNSKIAGKSVPVMKMDAEDKAGLVKPSVLAGAMALAASLFPTSALAVTPDEIWTYAGYTELLIFYGIANGFLLIYLFDEIDRQAGRFD
mmetsp:Transcript_51380/g.96275  ORF Transcript_51380/g.96275 Transcript_51380/m.96275 type:complete len:145 (+) Transcript_51380:72-506(+)